jgi:hypothetical protein
MELWQSRHFPGLILTSATLLNTCCCLQDLGLSGSESWLQLALKVAARVLRQKVIASEKDEVAVILYNTVSRAAQLGL